MRRYETFVIIDPDISQEEREPVLERVRELMNQQDGFMVFEDVWGERKMAYEIKKKSRGFYVRFDYCGLAPLVNEIERFFRIDDRALKYMTVVLDKDVDLEIIKEEKAAADSQREPEPAPPAAPAEAESGESTQEPAAENQPEAAAPETPAAEEAPEAPAAEETPDAPAAEETPDAPAAEEAPEAPAAEEAPASDPTEPAENTTPVEKKEEA